jgi:hypothetical protein
MNCMIDHYPVDFSHLLVLAQNAAGRISFTTDIWSDQNRQPYLAVTAHWISKSEGSSSLQLKAALIAFHRLRGSHDGKTLAKTIVELLDRADITVQVSTVNGQLSFVYPKSLSFPFQVGHFTVDNASSNETMMQELEKLFNERDIPFDAADRKIMCYGHIVDLSSGRVIKKLTNDSESDDSNSDADDSDDEHEDHALTRSQVVAHARSVVRAIRGSGMRRDTFRDVIKNGNANKWFKEGPKVVIVKELELLRDVRTRWDSVYAMLNRLRELRPV